MIRFDTLARAIRDHIHTSASDAQINRILVDILPNPQSGFSVGGVQVWGDKRSIDAVRAWHHDSTALVPALRWRLDEEMKR